MSTRSTTHPLLLNGGATNTARLQGQRFARQLLESDDYRQWCQERIRTKTLPPAVEIMLWAYAHGKPKETIDVNLSSQNDLSNLSVDELRQRAADIAVQLSDANALAAELNATAETTSVH